MLITIRTEYADPRKMKATSAPSPSYLHFSGLMGDQTKAFQGIRSLVADVLDDMHEVGEAPPTAFSDRSYSGKFMVRITPEAHRQLALDKWAHK